MNSMLPNRLVSRPGSALAAAACLCLAGGLVGLAADPPTEPSGAERFPSRAAAGDPDFDAEEQVWQGRVIRAQGGDLTLRVEGEPQSFDVAPDAEIRKNRRPSSLSKLAPRDFATVVSVGGKSGEQVVRIRAFSLK